jgi:hypothetical protein
MKSSKKERRFIMKYKSFASGLLGAVACAGVSLSSLAQEVYSPNVVGFQKLSVVTNGSRMVMASTPFDATSNNINNVIGPQLYGSNTSAKSANVIVWNKTNQSYKSYWLAGTISAGNPLNNKWIDGSKLASNAIVDPGMSFWMKQAPAGSQQQVVVCGEVVDIPTSSIPVLPGMQMLSYPYNTDIYLTQTTFYACGAYGTNTSAKSDQVIVWIPTNQAYKSYWLAGTIGPANPLNNQWIDGSKLASNTVLRSGQGFWYKHRSTGFVWIESRPYTL